MNSGLRDAHNLAWKLAAVVKGQMGAGLLTTYQREREPHAWALIELAMNMGRIMMPTSERQAFFVQNAFRLAAKLVPPLHAYFAQMKYKPKPFYHDGFIADDGGLKLSGRMLPQATLETHDGTRLRLDDVAGAGFAIVAIGEDAQALASAVDVAPLGLGSVPRIAIVPQKINLDPKLYEDITQGRDLDNHFGEIAPRAQNMLVLLRPDRYVALAMKVEKAQTPGTFIEMAKGLIGLMK
jgi:3-(3-hydroxy-phenyl)propionate hydroxylase